MRQQGFVANAFPARPMHEGAAFAAKRVQSALNVFAAEATVGS